VPRPRSFAKSRGGATHFAIGLIALTVAAVGLSVAALRQGRGPGDVDATVGPAPTFTYAVRTPTATATPTASASPTPAGAPGATERFLSVGADAMWRATAGACGGAAPVVERSGDNGATWQSVTPTAKSAVQMLSLTSFGGRNATAVTALGANCTLNTLRTYTDGRFWEPYPDIFAVDTYVLPGERAVIVDGTRIAAPCATPWGLRSAGSTTAIVCDDAAYRLDGQNWTRLAQTARAVAVSADTVYIAQTDAACSGIRITAHSSDATGTSDLGCTTLDAADAAGPLALDASSSASGTVLTLWAGSRLIDIAG